MIMLWLEVCIKGMAPLPLKIKLDGSKGTLVRNRLVIARTMLSFAGMHLNRAS